LVVQTAPKQKVYIYRAQSSKGQNGGRFEKPRAIHEASPRVPRQSKELKFRGQDQGKGPSIAKSSHSPTRVFIHAKTRFCVSDCRRSRGRFCLYGPLSSSLKSQLSNKTSCSPFGVHLIGQPQATPNRLSTGPNPAYPANEATFGDNLQLVDSALRSNCFGSDS